MTKDIKEKIKVCSKCGKEYVGKYNYCNSCYKADQKQRRAEKHGYWLYIFTDANGQVLYVGKSLNLYYRIRKHLTYNSHLAKQVKSNTWKYVKTLDVSQIVKNDEELKLLENSLIELYKPVWNEQKNIIRNVDKLRELELLAELHSVINIWEIYTENKQENC